jgi:hypothetical protein
MANSDQDTIPFMTQFAQRAYLKFSGRLVLRIDWAATQKVGTPDLRNPRINDVILQGIRLPAVVIEAFPPGNASKSNPTIAA